MIEPRTFKIESTLARKMAQPGGRTMAEMERRADERLDRHRTEVMASIGATITQLERVVAAEAPGSEASVYPLASSLLDTGGFFDTGPLYDAGYSLCDLADRMNLSGWWRWPSIGVHVQALKMILMNDCKTDATSDALLEGLRAVVAKARQEAGAA